MYDIPRCPSPPYIRSHAAWDRGEAKGRNPKAPARDGVSISLPVLGEAGYGVLHLAAFPGVGHPVGFELIYRSRTASISCWRICKRSTSGIA